MVLFVIGMLGLITALIVIGVRLYKKKYTQVERGPTAHEVLRSLMELVGAEYKRTGNAYDIDYRMIRQVAIANTSHLCDEAILYCHLKMRRILLDEWKDYCAAHNALEKKYNKLYTGNALTSKIVHLRMKKYERRVLIKTILEMDLSKKV